MSRRIGYTLNRSYKKQNRITSFARICLANWSARSRFTPRTEYHLGMDTRSTDGQQQRLLSTLEQLLAIESTSVKPALDRASDLIAGAIKADKVDAFLYDPTKESLVAVGTSNTPMGIRQRQVGLDRLPLANDGPEAKVFYTGTLYITGHAEQDPTVPVGLVKTLGVRSTIIAPMIVNG